MSIPIHCAAPPFTSTQIRRIKVNNGVSKSIKVNKGGTHGTPLNVAQLGKLLCRRLEICRAGKCLTLWNLTTPAECHSAIQHSATVRYKIGFPAEPARFVLEGVQLVPHIEAVRAHGMWTYEPRQGRKAATVVCSTSAVVTLALFFHAK